MPKFIDDKCYLTENDLVKNFKNVFGYDCPQFSKMIYLMLSNGMDKEKISLSRFIRSFAILKKEEDA